MKKRVIIITSISVLLALCVIFIFSNSLKTGSETKGISDTVKEVIAYCLSPIGITENIPRNHINILGHFAEFFALSTALTVAAIIIFPINFKKPFSKRLLIYFSPVGISLIIAFIDEFIQIFSPGRSSDIMDVLVDFIGAATANLIIMGIIFIIYAIKRKKSKD